MVSTVQKSYRKNILREMKSSISRVVSLFGIVALGVMMLTGLMCIAPDMRTAAQKYYVQQNVFDLRVLSTLGLSQGDIDAIAAVETSKLIESESTIESLIQAQGYSNCIVYLDGDSAKVVVQTEGLDAAQAAAIKDVILGEVSVPAENIRIFEVK